MSEKHQTNQPTSTSATVKVQQPASGDQQSHDDGFISAGGGTANASAPGLGDIVAGTLPPHDHKHAKLVHALKGLKRHPRPDTKAGLDNTDFVLASDVDHAIAESSKV